MRASLGRLFLTLMAAGVGWVVGYVAAAASFARPWEKDYPFLAEQVPLPHHVPKYQGGLSFRFAMAHDVIHERFPKHGAAHYRERNRLSREAMAELKPDDPARFPLADDLGAGLERLGHSAEAVEVLREKLARQEAQGISGRPLYTSYANLGTFLIHANAKQARGGDKAAKDRFREGLGYVRKSVEVNPEAHFGRERWQVSIAEFLLAAMDDPNLLKTFDCLGNRLDLTVEETINREANYPIGHGRPTDLPFSQGKGADVESFYRQVEPLDDPARWKELSPIRAHITKVGAERDWEKVPVASHRESVAFDEPVLGIIGMWRQGGGANPHFALALGETMLRVGQRYIAWTAFERASKLADGYAADPDIRRFLRDHCRGRQAQIEQSLLFRSAEKRPYSPPWQYVSPPPPPSAVAALRPDFEAELAFGEGYQRDYQAFEAAKIAAGVPITDEHFFDDFYRGRAPIETPVGPEEWYARVPPQKRYEYGQHWSMSAALFGAGVGASVTSLCLWLSKRRTRKPRPTAEDIASLLTGSGKKTQGDVSELD